MVLFKNICSTALVIFFMNFTSCLSYPIFNNSSWNMWSACNIYQVLMKVLQDLWNWNLVEKWHLLNLMFFLVWQLWQGVVTQAGNACGQNLPKGCLMYVQHDVVCKQQKARKCMYVMPFHLWAFFSHLQANFLSSSLFYLSSVLLLFEFPIVHVTLTWGAVYWQIFLLYIPLFEIYKKKVCSWWRGWSLFFLKKKHVDS